MGVTVVGRCGGGAESVHVFCVVCRYPVVAKTALMAQHCRIIAGIPMLVAEPSLRCREGVHVGITITSWIAMVVFVAGIPGASSCGGLL